jgi:GNAT superfamily N-acetyltransferase
MVEIRTPKNEQEWNAYYDLRYRILRQPLGQAIGSERNEGDTTGIHFALYEERVVKAIARLDLQEKQVAQVRFVAVETDVQGKGFGKKIMLATEKEALNKGCKLLILHARENALPFYEGLGYKLIEKSYLLFDQIQHFYMEKELI